MRFGMLINKLYIATVYIYNSCILQLILQFNGYFYSS
jgi:hypothetical protein